MSILSMFFPVVVWLGVFLLVGILAINSKEFKKEPELEFMYDKETHLVYVQYVNDVIEPFRKQKDNTQYKWDKKNRKLF